MTVRLQHRGSAFGSRVESDLPLPLGASSSALGGSVWIRRGEPERVYPTDRRLERLGAPQEVKGVVSPRRRTVWVDPTEQDPWAVSGTVMGLSLPHLLSARGSMVLRASCAVKDGTAVAFVGGGRSGKSSIAAGLVASGWRLVADDSLVLNTSDDAVRVRPSFPALKLWTPLAASLASSLRAETAPTDRELDRRWVFLGEKHWWSRPRVDLACLCLLEHGPPDELRGPQTVLSVLAATYDPDPGLKRNWRRWFEGAHRLASSVPVLRLPVPAHFDPRFRFVRAVTRHLRAAGLV